MLCILNFHFQPLSPPYYLQVAVFSVVVVVMVVGIMMVWVEASCGGDSCSKLEQYGDILVELVQSAIVVILS